LKLEDESVDVHGLTRGDQFLSQFFCVVLSGKGPLNDGRKVSGDDSQNEADYERDHSNLDEADVNELSDLFEIGDKQREGCTNTR